MSQRVREYPTPMAGLFIVLLLLPGARLWSQATGTVRGTVTGAAAVPLVGAQVIILGTGSGDRTNSAGDYVIASLRPGTYTVRAQVPGYGPEEQSVTVAAGEVARADLQLSLVAIALDEIVVTGTAGRQTRRSQPAQVAVLNTDQIIRAAPKLRIAEILQSRLPGVSVTQGSGTTGAAQRIRIRGASSISLSNEPLVFIDGVRADSRTNSVNHPGGGARDTGGQATSRLNDLNPEDVESIEVVKGPAAATLYGADASAGVIQIITKQGRVGSFRQNVVAEYDMIDAHYTPPDNWAVCTQAEINDGTPVCQGLTAGTLVSDNPLVREQVFKTGHMEQLNWNGSAGSESFRFFLSAGGLNETGVMPASELKRGTARLNTTWSPQPNLTLNLGYGFITSDTRLPDNNHSVYGFLANAMVGTPLTLGLRNNGWLDTRGPADMASILSTVKLLRHIPTLEINYQPVGWLSQRFVVGADFSQEERLKHFPKNDRQLWGGALNDGSVGETRSSFRQITADYLGHVTHSFGRDQSWDSDLAFGLQMILIRSDLLWADGVGLATNSARVVSAAAQSSGGQQRLEERSIGYMGQYQLGYRDRVYVQLGLRVDQNSSFGEEVAAVYLPKVGASWVISEEPFFQRRFPVLNQLRLRAAYGATGRAPRSGSAAESWQPRAYASGTQVGPGLDLLNPGNPDLRPERGTEIEAGLDAGLFDNRLGLELTYFRKLTKDLLLQRQLPVSAGYLEDPFANIGKVLNRGLEAALSAQVINGRRLAWDVRLGMNTLHNKLLDLGGLPPFGTNERFVEGRELSSWFSPRVKRIDVANNVAIVSDTLEFVGGKLPKYEGSLSSSTTLFGNLRVAAQFDGKAGFKLNNFTKSYRDRQVVRNREAVDPQVLSPEERLRRFGPYRSESGAPVNANLVTELYYEDGDFIRFRELSVSYSVPQAVSRRFGAQRATIAAGGRNLALWTKYTGSDPETISRNEVESQGAFNAYEFFNLPPARRFFLRLTLDF